MGTDLRPYIRLAIEKWRQSREKDHPELFVEMEAESARESLEAAVLDLMCELSDYQHSVGPE